MFQLTNTHTQKGTQNFFARQRVYKVAFPPVWEEYLVWKNGREMGRREGEGKRAEREGNGRRREGKARGKRREMGREVKYREMGGWGS